MTTNRRFSPYFVTALLISMLFLTHSSVTWASMKSPEDFLEPGYFDQPATQGWDTSASYQEILNLLKVSDYPKAITSAKKLVGERPADARAHLLLTLAWLGNGDEKQLGQHLKELDSVDKDTAALIRLTTARFYASDKRYYKSLSIIQDLSNPLIQTQLLKLRGDIYTKQGRTTEALETYLESYRLDPANPDTLLNLARLNLINRNLEDAGRYAKELLKLQPHNTPATFILGNVSLMAGDLPAAQAAFRSSSAEDPISQLGLGLIALIEKDYPSARSHFQTVLKHFPSMSEALQGLAITHIATGDQSQALVMLQKAKAATPNDPLLHLIEAAGFASRGKLESAKQRMQQTGALFFDMSRPAAELNDLFNADISKTLLDLALANYLYRQGYFRLTVKHIEAQGTDEKLPPLSLLTKARALAKEGEDTRALELYQLLSERYPSLLSPIMEQADIHFRLNHPQQAVKGYQRVVQMAPGSADLHLRLGNLYNHLNQARLAIQQYKEAAAIKGAHTPLALGSIATTLLEKELNPREALKYAERALKLAPHNPQLLLLEGNIHLAAEAYAKALAVYSKLAAGNALKEPVDFYRYGLLLLKDGKADDALRAFETSLNFGQDFPERELAIKQYLALTGS